MRTEEEIKAKLEELEEEKVSLDDQFEEALSDEDVKEDSEDGQRLRLEYDEKEEVLKQNIKLLEWVIGE